MGLFDFFRKRKTPEEELDDFLNGNDKKDFNQKPAAKKGPTEEPKQKGIFSLFKKAPDKKDAKKEAPETEKPQEKNFVLPPSGIRKSDEKSHENVQTAKPKKKEFAGKFKPRKTKIIFIALILGIFLAGLIFFRLIPKYAPAIKSYLPGVVAKIKGIEKPSTGAGGGLITPQEAAIKEAISVRAYKTARIDFIDILPAMGTVKGDREIELRFPSNGVVDSINFYEGDIVKKGDIIATIQQKDALLKLDYAKSKLKTAEVAQMSAKKKFEIHESLFKQGIIIKPKLEEARLEYESAKSKAKSAEKEVEFSLSELDKTYLYSPVDGVMGTRDAEVGEFVTSNIRIASLYDISFVMVEFGVIEKDVNRIALGQEAKVNVDTYPGVDFKGNVDNIAPIIEGKSRTLTVKVRLKNDNPKGTLMPGMFARVWVSVYEKKNVIKIPSEALYDLDNNGEFDSVYVINKDNIARARPVKVGYITSDFVEITDGLDEGEQIVTEALKTLKDGSKVEIIETQEALF